MIEFELRRPLIDSDPRRKGSITIGGILVKRGRHIPVWERSLEGRRDRDRQEAKVFEELSQIEKESEQVVIAMQLFGENAREHLLKRLKELNRALLPDRRHWRERLEGLIKENGGNKEIALIQVLNEAGVSSHSPKREGEADLSEDLDIPGFLKKR